MNDQSSETESSNPVPEEQVPAVVAAEDAASTRVAAENFSRDPFPAWAPGVAYADQARTETILANPDVQEWFSRMDTVRRAGLYTYCAPAFASCGTRGRHLDRPMVSFSSYHYLSLGQHPRIVQAANKALHDYGVGAGGARLLTGNTHIHMETERELATWLEREDCLIFASGYDANLAVLSGLFGAGDTAVIDRFAHRSLLDGCTLAGMTVKRFQHNDMAHCEELVRESAADGGKVIIIVDGVYSMGGDEAPLGALVDIKHRYGVFLLVDDAHAIGLYGPNGEGTAHHQGIDPAEIDVTTHSLSKSLPAGGGSVLGTRAMITYLRHNASPAIFSAGQSPVTTAATLEAIKVVRDEPIHREKAWAATEKLRTLLDELHFEPTNSSSPILPLMLHDTTRALMWARLCLDHNVFASPVIYPAVANGQERLRLCANAGHVDADFEALKEALSWCQELEENPVELGKVLARYAMIDRQIDLSERGRLMTQPLAN